jgi:hypothetical protein
MRYDLNDLLVGIAKCQKRIIELGAQEIEAKLSHAKGLR